MKRSASAIRVGVIGDHGKMIALGTPKELIDSLGGSQIVELDAPGARSSPEDCAALAASLATLPGIVAARFFTGLRRPARSSDVASSRSRRCSSALRERSDARSRIFPPITRRSRTCSSRSPGERFVSEKRAARSTRIVELALARFRLFYREPGSMFLTFGFPDRPVHRASASRVPRIGGSGAGHRRG